MYDEHASRFLFVDGPAIMTAAVAAAISRARFSSAKGRARDFGEVSEGGARGQSKRTLARDTIQPGTREGNNYICETVRSVCSKVR